MPIYQLIGTVSGSALFKSSMLQLVTNWHLSQTIVIAKSISGVLQALKVDFLNDKKIVGKCKGWPDFGGLTCEQQSGQWENVSTYLWIL